MAEDVLVFNAKNTLIDSIQDFYTATISGGGTRVNAFTASNAVTSSVDYKAYIYDSSGSVQSAVIPQTTVVRDKFDLGPSVVGQLIPPGGSLRMESSQVGGILFYVTGDLL